MRRKEHYIKLKVSGIMAQNNNDDLFKKVDSDPLLNIFLALTDPDFQS